MALRIFGHANDIIAQMRIANTIIWIMSVRLKFTLVSCAGGL
jgi:hypothetical protein